jgi:hypothetical protein
MFNNNLIILNYKFSYTQLYIAELKYSEVITASHESTICKINENQMLK